MTDFRNRPDLGRNPHDVDLTADEASKKRSGKSFSTSFSRSPNFFGSPPSTLVRGGTRDEPITLDDDDAVTPVQTPRSNVPTSRTRLDESYKPTATSQNQSLSESGSRRLPEPSRTMPWRSQADVRSASASSNSPSPWHLKHQHPSLIHTNAPSMRPSGTELSIHAPSLSATLQRPLPNGISLIRGGPNTTSPSPVDPRPWKAGMKRWICENCAEERIGCDGEVPCSNCTEPGLPCNYLGRSPVAPTRTQVLSNASPTAASYPPLSTNRILPETRFGTPGAGIEKSTSLSRSSTVLSSNSAVGNILLKNSSIGPEKAGTTGVKSTTVTGSQTESLSRDRSVLSDQSKSRQSSHAPMTSISNKVPESAGKVLSGATGPKSPISLEVADIEVLVRKYEAQMRAHRAYVIRPLLRRARFDMRRSGQLPLDPPPLDPFANLKGTSLPIVDDSSVEPLKGQKLQVQTKSFIDGGAPPANRWKSSLVPVRDYEVEQVALPKYRSIGRLPSTTLVRNYHTLKYIPYFAENEYADESQKKNIDELEERYKQDLPQLTSQRKCRELMDMWRPWVDEILAELDVSFTGICYYLLHIDYGSFRLGVEMSSSARDAWRSGAHHQCPTCKHSNLVEDSIASAVKRLPNPEPRKLALAGLLCHVFQSVSQINLWHFAAESPEIRKILEEKRLRQQKDNNNVENVLCLVCYRHHCPTHGAFKEDEMEKTFESAEVSIDDPEFDNNQRQYVTLPIKTEADPTLHKCGVFCGDPDLSLAALCGRRADGTVGGSIRCHDVSDGGSWFPDNKDCGPNCFVAVEKRPDHPAKIKDIDRDTLAWLKSLTLVYAELFEAMMPLFLTNTRGPCMIASFLPGAPCLNVFYYLVYETNRTVHNEVLIAQSQLSKVKAKNRPDLSRPDFSMTHKLDSRPVFIPCSHAGPCQGNPDCSCFTNKIVCEWFCGCDMSCKRRYQGCTCAAGGKGVCSTDRCECYVTNRECDPHLCGPCGVAETLDPVNRYNEDARKGRCKNNCLQLGTPRRTVKGPSEVQGWGLFAGEDIAAREYIGEYKGEVVSNQESDRRGAIYHNLGQEYLFVVNRDQEIDASIAGNKMRFMNDSQRAENINVEAKKMLCNGVQRIMLYAQKNIKAGDELLYNYNYPSSVVKKFWERGEGPTSKMGVATTDTTSKKGPVAGKGERYRQNGRFAKTGNVLERGAGVKTTTAEASGRSGSAGQASSAAPNGRKRKWTGEARASSDLGDGFASSPRRAARQQALALGSSFDEKAVIEESESEESDFDAKAVVANSDDSEDEESDEEEESEEEVSEVESEAVGSKSRRKSGKDRQRKIQPGDRRFGGEVQRIAWETRKRNLARGRGGGVGGGRGGRR